MENKISSVINSNEFKNILDSCVDNFYDVNNLENYHLTLKNYQEQLLNELRDCYINVIKASEEDMNNELDNDLFLDTTEEEDSIIMSYFNSYVKTAIEQYHDSIEENLDRIDCIDVPEQRTPEWYAQRAGIISASEVGNACHIMNKSNYETTLYKKLGINCGSSMGNAALHGTIFEVVTQSIYELRYGVSIMEYGCLPHKKHTFIGASPDGIVKKVNDINDINQLSLYGRMIEIKNPYSRKINNDIKPEYAIQMQTQLEVADLYICDFIESEIKSVYSNIDELLNDKFILTDSNHELVINKNIPLCNLSSNGLEKGILLYFSKPRVERDEHIGIMYPLDIPYEKTQILKWAEETINSKKADGYYYNCMHYWKVNIYDIKTVLRDFTRWNDFIYPNLRDFWDNVEELKELTNEQLIERFDNIEDYPERNITNPLQRKLNKKVKSKYSKKTNKNDVVYIF